jgi:CheY-like chemotaxis protein
MDEDAARLTGKVILVVEDDRFTAGYVGSVLERAGASVMGPAPSVADALVRLADARPDGATVGVDLTDGLCWPVAHRLHDGGVPFLFLSRRTAQLPPEWRERHLLCRPFAGHQVVDALCRIVTPRP